MVEVVLLSLAMYTGNNNRPTHQWQEVKSAFTSMSECQYYINSVNNPQSVERLACILRYR